MKKNNFIQHRFGAGFIGKVFITNSPKETQELGENFAKSLQAGDTIALYGNLGSGKTTFVQGLAEGLGVKGRIVSPTFVIVRSHKLGVGSFYHIDLYRVGSEKDVESLGIEEIMSNKNNIVIIEWAEKLGKHLPKKRIDIEFSYEEGNVRKIMFRSLNQ